MDMIFTCVNAACEETGIAKGGYNILATLADVRCLCGNCGEVCTAAEMPPEYDPPPPAPPPSGPVQLTRKPFYWDDDRDGVWPRVTS